MGLPNSSGAASLGSGGPGAPSLPEGTRALAPVSFPAPRPGFVTIFLFALAFTLAAAWQDVGSHRRSRQ